jgi:hypothetical protein
MTITEKRDARRALRACRQRLTLDELKTRDARAYHAFMEFTEAQTMFWELSVGTAGDMWAEDYQMDTRVQWVPEIGLWQ